MAVWTGGPCPDCGDVMPPRLIRCATCRALLNPDLRLNRIQPPPAVTLQEVESVIDVQPVGYYIDCPHCQRELRIHGKYLGQNVVCKLCSKAFVLNPDNGVKQTAFYTVCPHCSKEIRAARKYMGAKVACKFCNGAIRFVDPVHT